MADYIVSKEILGKPREKYWITYIKQRIKKNKNFLGFISGQTGSGKSYCSLRICEELDPNFNVDQCIFTGMELMDLINSGKLKKGSAIVFEEVGVGLSNRNWQSVINKLINFLLQTFRHKNFILIMNSPYMDFVDASTRKLFHAEMRTIGINLKKNEVKLKPQHIQYNSRMQKFYYKRLKVIMPEGRIPIDLWNVAKPSESLRVAYEKKKLEYTTELNKNITNELKAIAQKDNKKNVLTEVQQDTLNLISKGLNIKQIAKARNRSVRAIEESFKSIRMKGYKIKPIMDKNHKSIKKYEIIGT